MIVHEQADLTVYNTLGFKATAERLILPDSLAACREALALAATHDWPMTLLGGGSNVVLRPYLPGVVIVPSAKTYRFESVDEEIVHLHADAGVDWPTLVVEACRAGYWGIENLALIPGRCGAAPVQNIGAYGVELADVLERVEVLYLDGREATLSAAQAKFGYRDSIFKQELAGRCLITGIVLRLRRSAEPILGYGDLTSRVSLPCTPLDVANAVSAIRREKLPDPRVTGNAGSFFKNPVVPRAQGDALLAQYPQMPHFSAGEASIKVPAAWLIDQCGFKGCVRDTVGVHDRQALVLINRGGGDAEALLALADEIERTVRTRFDITLEREPRILGQ